MIKVVAIDDEPLALEVIANYCERVSFLELLQTFTDVDKAIRYLNKFEVDLLLLDIQMPAMNGLDLYRSLKTSMKLVFTTAFSEYAVEGFNVRATDYLLKPFSFDRFLEAAEKVRYDIDLERNSSVGVQSLSLRADFKLYRISYDEILLIEAWDDYIRVYLEDSRKIVARSTMKGILKKLPATRFVRVHRSYIVPVLKIESISKEIIKIAGFEIPVSPTYKPGLLKFLES